MWHPVRRTVEARVDAVLVGRFLVFFFLGRGLTGLSVPAAAAPGEAAPALAFFFLTVPDFLPPVVFFFLSGAPSLSTGVPGVFLASAAAWAFASASALALASASALARASSSALRRSSAWRLASFSARYCARSASDISLSLFSSSNLASASAARVARPGKKHEPC